MDLYLTEQLVKDHGAEMLTAGRRSRLASLAACCRPSTWARWARGAADAVRRTVRPTDATCCAAA